MALCRSVEESNAVWSKELQQNEKSWPEKRTKVAGSLEGRRGARPAGLHKEGRKTIYVEDSRGNMENRGHLLYNLLVTRS